MSEYKLVALSDPDEIERCHERNQGEWGSGLTKDQYLDREIGVRKVLEAHNMHITYWGFYAGNDLVAAFESLERQTLLICPSGSSEYTIKNGTSHSIGSVFTPKEYRGRGYAAKMMSLGVEALNKESSLVALWSDIGNYYGKFGYKLKNNHEICITVGSSVDPPVSAGKGLEENDVPDIALEDKNNVIKVAGERAIKDGEVRVIIPPEPGVFANFIWRSKYLGPFISNLNKAPSEFGWQINGSSVLWYHDFGNKTLYILRVVVAPTLDAKQALADTVALVKATVAEACKWGLPKVTLWDEDVPVQVTPQQVLEELSGLSAVHHAREGSWPMALDNPWKWEFCGKYCWF